MLENITDTTELLQYFTSTAVTFATADNSIAATGIGTAFPTAGDLLVITGAAESANNITFTVVSATANKVIVSETVTAESAGATVVINQEWRSGWKQTFQYKELLGGVSASQNCIAYIDQANKKEATTYYTTQYSVVSDIPIAFEILNTAHYSQLRIRNAGVDQTAMYGYLNGARG